jgi:hypothetical protein
MPKELRHAFGTDVYIQMYTMWVISWEELHRGRMNHARDSARELMKLGQLFNDPRSAGLGLWTFTIIAILSDSNAEALEHSEQSLATAVTPSDEDIAIGCKACALVLLRHTEDAAKMIDRRGLPSRCQGRPFFRERPRWLCWFVQGPAGRDWSWYQYY